MAESKMRPPPVDVPLTETVTLTFDRKGGQQLNPPFFFCMAITTDLARVFARAGLISRRAAPPLSFSSALDRHHDEKRRSFRLA
jgi:hypothetical protein